MLYLIIAYLFGLLGALGWAAVSIISATLPPWLEALRLAMLCALMGGVGGCVYCLRGVYLHKCVEKNWSADWYVWYFLRPLVSVICGGVSYLFLKAGLLILESGTRPEATEIGFYALAFIAGLNVDKFIAKIEDVAQAAWGIEKSRATKANRASD